MRQHGESDGRDGPVNFTKMVAVPMKIEKLSAAEPASAARHFDDPARVLVVADRHPALAARGPRGAADRDQAVIGIGDLLGLADVAADQMVVIFCVALLLRGGGAGEAAGGQQEAAHQDQIAHRSSPFTRSRPRFGLDAGKRWTQRRGERERFSTRRRGACAVRQANGGRGANR